MYRSALYVVLLMLPVVAHAGYYKCQQVEVMEETTVLEKAGMVESVDADGKATLVQTYKPVTLTERKQMLVDAKAKPIAAAKNTAVLSQGLALVPGKETGDGYLGKDATEVVAKALKGDEDCREAALDLLYTTWGVAVDKPAKGEPDRISHRGSLREWIATGKPERESAWVPGVVLAGFPVPEIDHSDVEKLIKE